MEPNVAERLSALEGKMDALYVSVEKVRTYFKWMMIVSVALFVLPLIGVLFAIPSFITSYSTNLQTLSQ